MRRVVVVAQRSLASKHTFSYSCVCVCFTLNWRDIYLRIVNVKVPHCDAITSYFFSSIKNHPPFRSSIVLFFLRFVLLLCLSKFHLSFVSIVFQLRRIDYIHFVFLFSHSSIYFRECVYSARNKDTNTIFWRETCLQVFIVRNLSQFSNDHPWTKMF